jgi:aspartyl-tRNA(Asn)/glutamyl-tRNA(Gln) amidotransferase subunit C
MENIKETVMQVAKLANLEYQEHELDTIAPQFEKIIDYIDKINKISLDEFEPLCQVVASENFLREDIAKESISLQDALKNAPKKNESFFKVPKVRE